MKMKITKDVADKLCFRGRIVWKEDMAVLGYTNSSVTIHFKGTKLKVSLRTGHTDTINLPGLRIYMDVVEKFSHVMNELEQEVMLFESEEPEEHTIRVVKITEAAMSYVGFAALDLDGELLPVPEDRRTKALFIGDSITCGYGVLGAPDSEYDLREEDGELCYAAFLARNMNWNAEWVSASGHGTFVDYLNDTENVLPREFPYTNWFYDKETREDFSRFQPEYIIVNLGTNDSGPIWADKSGNTRRGFLASYERFLYVLRKAYPEAKIICVLGTVAPGMFKFVEQVVAKVNMEGLKGVYGVELPEHDVEHDGMASGHPSKATHEKDAKRIEEFIRRMKL